MKKIVGYSIKFKKSWFFNQYQVIEITKSSGLEEYGYKEYKKVASYKTREIAEKEIGYNWLLNIQNQMRKI